MLSGLQDAICSAQSLIGYLGRWLGSVGAFVANLGSPDVQDRAEDSGDGWLELVDIPLDRTGESWQPKVSHKEARNIAAESSTAPASIRAQAGARPKAQVHVSHRLFRAGAYTFCWRCGGHSSGRKSQLLAGQCLRTSLETVAVRLRLGRHPTTGEPLGAVVAVEDVETPPPVE